RAASLYGGEPQTPDFSVNTKLEQLKTVQVELAEVKTELKGINQRLDSQEFINRFVAVGFILAFVSGLIKLFFPNLLPH
ncbi:MAG: hypothetical protein AB4062_13910, partial [Crocosphaera sp.]